MFLDTEDNSKGKFLLGVIDFKNKKYVFTDKFKMKKFILDKKRITVYAHNIAYDIGNIFDIHKLKYKYNKSHFIGAVYESNGSYIKFCDSFNLLPISIKKIGKFLNLEKMKMIKNNLLEYCKRDVDILKKFIVEMRNFFKSVLKIKMGNTLSLNALRFFRKLNPGIDLKINKKFDSFIRMAYYGGRVEIFKYGFFEKKLFENDVNSLYPSAMKRLKLTSWKSLKYSESKLNLNREGVVSCLVHEENDIPILPIRHKRYGLMFVNGWKHGVYCLNELRYALNHGVKIKKVFWHISSGVRINNVFEKYVDTLYKLKSEERNEYRRMLFKLLLNSLYGKFGFNGGVDKLYSLDDDENYIGETYFSSYGNMYGMNSESIDTDYQNVYFASYITAESRIILHEYLKKYVKNLYYCDTDSIISDKMITDENDILGLLSYRGSYFHGNFIQPKLYSIGEKYRAKGFKLKSKKEFDKLIKNKSQIIVRPYKIRTAIKYDKPVNYWHEEIRKIKNMRTKRKIIDKYGNTRPFEIKELKEKK